MVKSSKLSPAARETIACMVPLLVAAAPFILLFLVPAISAAINRSCAYGASIAQPTLTELSSFACAEFFLNRYQTLLGIAGALVAAAIAAAPVWRQVSLSTEQILIAGLPFVNDAIEHNADDRQRLTKISALLSQIETLGWFIDVFGEAPEPALSEAIKRHFDRICETAKSTVEGWSDFEDHARLGEQERKNRIALFAILQNVTRVFLKPLVFNPFEDDDIDNLRLAELILSRYGEVAKDGYPALQAAWELNSRTVREEGQLLRKHAVAVRKSIANLTAN
jgi:hypothetical protein